MRILPVSRLKDVEDPVEKADLSTSDLLKMAAAAIGVITVVTAMVRDLLETEPELDEESKEILEKVKRPMDDPKEHKPRESKGLLQRLGDFLRVLVSPVEKPVVAPPPAVSPSIPTYTATEGGERKKFTFTGFKGSEGVSKFGSYTDQEAAVLVNLRNRNADTSASLKSRPDIVAMVRRKARAAGLDENRILKVMFYESGGNPNAVSATGAIGLFQFTGATATAMGIKNRFDPEQNVDGALKLYRDNMRHVGQSELANYMVHQIGPSAAKELVKAKPSTRISSLSKDTQKLLKHNNAKGSETVGSYLARTQTAMDSRMDMALELPGHREHREPVASAHQTTATRPERVVHSTPNTAAPRTARVAQSAVMVHGIPIGVH
jgi:hypothetical protein